MEKVGEDAEDHLAEEDRVSAYSERTIVPDGIVEGSDTEGEERQRILVQLFFLIVATLTSVQRLSAFLEERRIYLECPLEGSQ